MSGHRDETNPNTGEIDSAVTPSRRIVKRHGPADRARGIAADLRECIGERTVDRGDLRELAGRLDALASDLEGTP